MIRRDSLSRKLRKSCTNASLAPSTDFLSIENNSTGRESRKRRASKRKSFATLRKMTDSLLLDLDNKANKGRSVSKELSQDLLALQDSSMSSMGNSQSLADKLGDMSMSSVGFSCGASTTTTESSISVFSSSLSSGVGDQTRSKSSDISNGASLGEEGYSKLEGKRRHLEDQRSNLLQKWEVDRRQKKTEPPRSLSLDVLSRFIGPC